MDHLAQSANIPVHGIWMAFGAKDAIQFHQQNCTQWSQYKQLKVKLYLSCTQKITINLLLQNLHIKYGEIEPLQKKLSF